MFLENSTDALKVVTTAAVTTDVFVVWSNFKEKGRSTSAITSATTTILTGADDANGERTIDHLNIHNKHASSSQGVTLNHVDSATSTTTEIIAVTLLAGECLRWVTGAGFKVYDTNGMEKLPSNGLIVTRSLGATVSISSATPAEVLGLKVAGVAAGVYQFQYYIIYQAAATTTGVIFSVNFDGTVTKFVANMRCVDAIATAATGAADQDAVASTMQVMAANSARAKSTAGWAGTLSVDTQDADMLMIVEGTMVVSVAGELEFWHGSEVAAASSVMSGSSLVLTKVG